MTALKKYQKLETTGLWRASQGDQRREVIVSFGDATLVLSDTNDRALAHWSLAALVRMNPRARPAVFAPDSAGSESVEIDDETMIRAIEKVIGALGRAKPHPGRLRLFTYLAGAAALIALCVFWLPQAMVRHAVSVVPPVAHAEIGQSLLSGIVRLSGEPCQTQAANRALEVLQSRLAPEVHSIVVLKSGVHRSEHLPGGIVLLNRSVLEEHETPDVAVGYIVTESLRAARTDPLERMLGRLGLVQTFRLLTSGRVAEAALDAYAEDLLIADKAPVDDDALLDRFAGVGVSSSAYAYSVDITGETTLRLIEADPLKGQTTRPVLSDGDWIALRDICL